MPIGASFSACSQGARVYGENAGKGPAADKKRGRF